MQAASLLQDPRQPQSDDDNRRGDDRQSVPLLTYYPYPSASGAMPPPLWRRPTMANLIPSSTGADSNKQNVRRGFLCP